jgi:hypothetical protein
MSELINRIHNFVQKEIRLVPGKEPGTHVKIRIGEKQQEP